MTMLYNKWDDGTLDDNAALIGARGLAREFLQRPQGVECKKRWAQQTATGVLDRLYDELKHDDVTTEEWNLIYCALIAEVQKAVLAS